MNRQDENTKDKEIEARIAELLADDPDDFDELLEYMDSVENDYSGDLNDFTFREAIRSGAVNYVEEYIGDFDLNDEGASSSYLDETDDPNMQDILMENGAFRSWEYYDGYRFAVETGEWVILAFDWDFQEEVFEKYLEKEGLTREQVIHIIQNGYVTDEDKDKPFVFRRNFEDDFYALGITLKNGDIELKDMYWEKGGYTKELLEELGWTCEFEGESWKLETNGVYFIQ